MSNILFIIGGNDIGGVLTWSKDLAMGLQRNGFKLYFAAAVKGESYKVLSEFGTVFLLPNSVQPYSPIVLAKIPLYSPLQLVKNWNSVRKNSKVISDLVDEHNIGSIVTYGFTSIPKLKVKKLSKVKIISVLHTVPRIDTTPFKIKSRFIGFKLSKADIVVSVGNTAIDRLKKYTEKEIILIPNSCRDFSVYSDKRAAIENNLGIAAGSFCMGTLGRFSKSKGFKEVIQVFEELAPDYPNLHCVLGGDPSEMDLAYYREVVDYANSSACSSRIHFTGKISNIDFYPIIDLYLMICVNSIESFGLVLIEAMSAKIPVVATGRGGPVDIISHRKSGFLVYDNKRINFVKYSKELLSNDTLYNDISREGRELYLNKYHLEVWLQKWFCLFSDNKIE
jgi:glycosyltransferase involved in cell wall biosynthesis